MRIFILLVSIFFVSACTPKFFKGMEHTGKEKIAKTDLCPIFGMTDTSTTFNMQIDYKENNFAGLLVVSNGEKEGSTRLIFTSYFGMTVFDFELDADSLNVNRCLEQMNKKIVLSLLEKDFQTLFLYNIPESIEANKYEKDSIVGYRLKAKDGNAYYLIDRSAQQIQKTYRPGCIKSLQIDFRQYEQKFPSSIEMGHPTIGLKMKLEIVK